MVRQSNRLAGRPPGPMLRNSPRRNNGAGVANANPANFNVGPVGNQGPPVGGRVSPVRGPRTPGRGGGTPARGSPVRQGAHAPNPNPLLMDVGPVGVGGMGPLPPLNAAVNAAARNPVWRNRNGTQLRQEDPPTYVRQGVLSLSAGNSKAHRLIYIPVGQDEENRARLTQNQVQNAAAVLVDQINASEVAKSHSEYIV